MSERFTGLYLDSVAVPAATTSSALLVAMSSLPFALPRAVLAGLGSFPLPIFPILLNLFCVQNTSSAFGYRFMTERVLDGCKVASSAKRTFI